MYLNFGVGMETALRCEALHAFKRFKLLWYFVANEYQFAFYMQDMAKVTYHYVKGNNPKKFATTLVSFLGKVSLLMFLFLVIWLYFPLLCGRHTNNFDLLFCKPWINFCDVYLCYDCYIIFILKLK